MQNSGRMKSQQEAERLTQAARYERNETRQGYHSGHYGRNLTTTSGDVTLHVPRLKGVSFETAIIERYRRRESSVEEALIEMYLAGVSVRRVEDITEALWGSKVSPATISELNKKAYVHIEDWRNRPLQGGKYPYVYVDGIYLRRNWGGEYENVAILVAIAVNEDGYREVLGAAEGMKEDKASWVNFFQWLKSRGCRMKSRHTILKGDSKPCPEKIVQLNEEVIKGQIKELVRGSVEETLNELLEAEAEKLTQAARYERNEHPPGLPQRPLQPQPYHHFRGRHPEGTQAQGDLF